MFVECLYSERGAVMFVMVHSVHNNIVLHIGTPCRLF